MRGDTWAGREQREMSTTRRELYSQCMEETCHRLIRFGAFCKDHELEGVELLERTAELLGIRVLANREERRAHLETCLEVSAQTKRRPGNPQGCDACAYCEKASKELREKELHKRHVARFKAIQERAEGAS